MKASGAVSGLGQYRSDTSRSCPHHKPANQVPYQPMRVCKATVEQKDASPGPWNRRWWLAVAGAVVVGAWWPMPVHAAPSWPQPPQLLLLADSNAAIVSQLKQLQRTQQKFGTQDPDSALASRFMGAQQQLQRIELLVKIQQYGNARMQLREGSFKSLRSDLRYESDYRGVQQEVAQGIIAGVEQLDRQLRSEESIETITTGIKQIQQQLQLLVDAAQPPKQ